MTTGNEEIMRAIGRIEGKIDCMDDRQQAHDKKLESISTRLRETEINNAKTGGVSGGLVAVLVLTIKHLVFGSNGGA